MTFGKAIIHNSLNRVFNTVVLFLTTVLLTRLIGASEIGMLTLLIANASVLNLISSLGISSGITFNLAAKNLEENKILSVAFFLLVAQLLLSIILEYGLQLFDGSFLLFKGYNVAGFLSGISFFISVSAIEKYTALFYGKQQYSIANNIVLLGNSALLITLVLLLLLKKGDTFTYIHVYILGSLFQALALIITFHFINEGRIRISFLDKESFKLFLSYSFLAFITNVLQFLAYRADFWLIEYYKGYTQLGVYSVSVRLAQLFWIIPNFIAAIIFPKVAGGQIIGNEYNFLFLIRTINTCNLFIGICLFLFSPLMVVWIFGSEYANSVLSFQLLLPGVIAFCITTTLASYFAGKNKLIVNFRGTVLCLLIILILDLALIPRFGIEGAAIASCIGYAASTVYSVIIFKNLTKVSFTQMFLLKKEDIKYLKRLLLTYVKV